MIDRFSEVWVSSAADIIIFFHYRSLPRTSPSKNLAWLYRINWLEQPTELAPQSKTDIDSTCQRLGSPHQASRIVRLLRKIRLASNRFPDEPLVHGGHKCVEVFTKHRMAGCFQRLNVESAVAQHNSIFGRNERTGIGYQDQCRNFCSFWHVDLQPKDIGPC